MPIALADGGADAPGAGNLRSSVCALVLAWGMPMISFVFRVSERLLEGGPHLGAALPDAPDGAGNKPPDSRLARNSQPWQGKPRNRAPSVRMTKHHLWKGDVECKLLSDPPFATIG